MSTPDTISGYLRLYGNALGERVLGQFPPLHNPGDPASPWLHQLKRRPFPAQALAILGIVKRFQVARCAAAIAECGTGKTLISLGSVYAAAQGRKFTALALVPPHLITKWAKECHLTLPGVRVFIVDGVRNGIGSNGFTGVNEVRLRNGRIVREGMKTMLSDVRLAKNHRSARVRWQAEVNAPSVWVLSREQAKLGYFWRHAYATPRSGPFTGNVVNPDTGRPILAGEDQLRRTDFRKVKHSELVHPENERGRKAFFSPLWQADNAKIHRMASMEFIGRFLGDGFFDYGIADEVHELKGAETAQGNALGTLASVCDRTVILTGTLLGGYADEVFSILYRLDARMMREEGFDYGEAGVRQFAETYGVLEKVTTIEPSENACSKARVTTTIKRRPGASPLLFGKYLMNLAAFVSLEDISEALPPYEEEVITVEMDPPLRAAYAKVEADISDALRQHHGNPSVISIGMNALLLYPDRPRGLGTLYGYATNGEGERERFVISEPADLDENFIYAKERRLIDETKKEIASGRNVQVFAVYTRKRDVTRRLQQLLLNEGIRTEVLTAEISPEQREAWYERKLRQGMQVCISHPRLVSTGLDLIQFPSIFFVQTGYSIYTLRQASRRSWRIG
ncbi:MAG: helicase C-terminal domain-containing protein [Bryobacterales bacterium]|nr:helicase C-terminal domain-containing protein [Bryobacterales bacterium]